MKIVLLLFSLSLVFFKTCDDTAAFPIGTAFEMEIGEELANESANLKVSWLEVSEDSRCPKNTNCVWEGQAKINLLVNGDPLTLTLRDGKPEEAKGIAADYIFEAIQLSPYPEGTAIKAADYRLQIKVSSL